MKKATIWVGSLWMVLAGCTPAPVPIEDYPSEALSASCRLLFDCCEPGMRRGYTDQAACVADLEASAGSGFDSLVARVMAGTIGYDGAAARECFDSAMCNLEAAPPSCDRVFSPVLADGEDCMLSNECIGGLCGTGGVCETLPGSGEACTYACARGFFCDISASMTCLPQLAAGEACTSSLECVSYSCDGGTCTSPASTFSLCAAAP